MDDRDADGVKEFCRRHGISSGFLYAEWRSGRGPRFMQVGDRRIISREAGADWRKEGEVATRVEAEPLRPTTPQPRCGAGLWSVHRILSGLMIYREQAEASSIASIERTPMSNSQQRPLATTARASEDRRAAAIRILLALAEVDPTISAAKLILPDGSTAQLDLAQFQRGGRA